MIQTSPNSNARLISLFNRVPFDELKPLFDLHELSDRGRSELVTAIREAGSHSILTFFGGDLKNYDEIVIDVAEKMNVDINDPNVKDELGLELLIIQSVFKEYFDKLSPEERENMEKEIAKLGMKMDDFNKFFLKAGAGVLVNILAQINGRILWQILARIIGGRLAYAGIGWFWALVPFLNVAFAGWIVYDLLGPAYRKTIPTVVQVALMRLEASVSSG